MEAQNKPSSSWRRTRPPRRPLEQFYCFDTVTVSSSCHFTQGRNRCWNRHQFDHQLGRLAALESAFRPNLSLGTQVAFFVTFKLRVLNYINLIISLGD
jgi:hypothetical protein